MVWAKIRPKRSTIAQLFTHGVAPQRITERLKILPSFIYKIVKQFKELGTVEEKPRSGRLRSVNVSRIWKVIKKRIIRNDSVNLNKIASDWDISLGSVQNIVKCEVGLRSYRLLQGHSDGQGQEGQVGAQEKTALLPRGGSPPKRPLRRRENFHHWGRPEQPKPPTTLPLWQELQEVKNSYEDAFPQISDSLGRNLCYGEDSARYYQQRGQNQCLVLPGRGFEEYGVSQELPALSPQQHVLPTGQRNRRCTCATASSPAMSPRTYGPPTRPISTRSTFQCRAFWSIMCLLGATRVWSL